MGVYRAASPPSSPGVYVPASSQQRRALGNRMNAQQLHDVVMLAGPQHDASHLSEASEVPAEAGPVLQKASC